ncbi:restriction endonuclease subunit S [Stenotrophomonas sp. TWI1149]|uniref:restriction endonuclease subunit S n=1 Tax=unclassified Stenotrophomonas TaxID=196198 RepID=UPI0032094B66
MIDVPVGWVAVSIGDVAEVNPRKCVDLPLDSIVTFVPMAAVSEVTGNISHASARPMAEVNRGFTQFAENDVIFAKITPSMENGKAAVADNLLNGIGFGSTEFHVLRSNGAVVPKFLWYFLRQQSFRDSARKVMTGAVGQQRVPADYLRLHPFLLPPLAEQHRILNRLDVLIARSARAKTELQEIPKLVAAYKSCILELAFSGKLTADLRGQANSQSSELPVGWTTRSLGEIGEIQSGIQVGKRRNSTDRLVEVPYLRVANVQRGWLNLNEIKTILVTEEERDRLLLKDGDVLMNEGGDRDKLGRGWVWREEIDACIHQNHVFRIRIDPSVLPAEFVSHFANERGQQYFFDEGTQTTNLASIGKRKVAALPLPVPPLDEAVEIVRRITRAFSWLDKLAKSEAAASASLEKLDAQLLAVAFSGQLVSQASEEEAATNTLSRVKDQLKLAKVSPAPQRLSRKIKTKESVVAVSSMVKAALKESEDWITAQDLFKRCGVVDGASTEQIEDIYSQLRSLEISGALEVQAIRDDNGRKMYDRLRLRRE